MPLTFETERAEAAGDSSQELRCRATDCAAEASVWYKKVPLCGEHFDRVRSVLRERGIDLYTFDGKIASLLSGLPEA